MSVIDDMLNPKPEIVMGEIYVKDASYETVHTPVIFRSKEQPVVDPKVHIEVTEIFDDWYEVVLCLNVSATLGGKTAYVVEVHQAGIFSFLKIKEEDRQKLLSGWCPRILYPFAREVAVSMVQKGNFSQLKLAPLEFDTNFKPPIRKPESKEAGT